MLNGFSKFIFVSSMVYSVGALAGADLSGGDIADDHLGAKTLTVMSYNVENLFDAEHDEGKDDYTFLPKSFPGKMQRCAAMDNWYYRKQCEQTDWKPELVEIKISQIKKVIEHQGFIPDLVGLQEVENNTVVRQLAKAVGYEKFLMTNSPDARGIDVALMFNQEKIQYLNHEELVVRFKDRPNSHSRNVLRVHFKIGKPGKKPVTEEETLDGNSPVLAVYVAHWPSQANPKEMRLEVAQKIKADIEKNMAKYGEINYHVVVMGDLNTPDSEMPNGIHNVLASPAWKKRLYDVQVLAKEEQTENTLKGPPGSYYYFKQGDWNRLDRFLVSGNMVGDAGDVQLMVHSFKLLTPDFMTYVHEEKNPKSPNYGKRMPHVPTAYDFGAVSAARAGFSDHLPVFMKLRLVK